MWRDYLRAVALSHGHSPRVVDEMVMRDLELLAIGARMQRHITLDMEAHR